MLSVGHSASAPPTSLTGGAALGGVDAQKDKNKNILNFFNIVGQKLRSLKEIIEREQTKKKKKSKK